MADFLLGQYKVEISDPDNTKVHTLDDWRSLDFEHKLNNTGPLTLRIDAFSDVHALFQTNSRIRVRRRIPGMLDWYDEWEGLHETGLEQIFQNGDRVYTCYASKYLTLLQRRTIMWFKNSAEAMKTATPAQTAIYEYVLENLGSYATIANGRLFDGAVSNFNLEGTGGGANWSGDRAFLNLLSVIQEISSWADIDFDIERDGDGFLFRTYLNQRGIDRTTIGLDPSTGLNAAGNKPVIFSLENQNVASISRTISHRGSANVVIALGDGQDGARAYEVVTDEAARTLNAGRLNQREVARNASGQGTSADLIVVGEEGIEKMQPTESVSFVPQRSEATLYGRDFWWADKCTVRFEGSEYHKRLTHVKISVGKRGENFRSWKFEDIPS